MFSTTDIVQIIASSTSIILTTILIELTKCMDSASVCEGIVFQISLKGWVSFNTT